MTYKLLAPVPQHAKYDASEYTQNAETRCGLRESEANCLPSASFATTQASSVPHTGSRRVGTLKNGRPMPTPEMPHEAPDWPRECTLQGSTQPT
eukprot:339022-Prymnesium_polylepis.1